MIFDVKQTIEIKMHISATTETEAREIFENETSSVVDELCELDNPWNTTTVYDKIDIKPYVDRINKPTYETEYMSLLEMNVVPFIEDDEDDME